MSQGERKLQSEFGKKERADRFYEDQMLDHLNDRMRAFVERMEMMFVSTADAHGNCDCSIRCGEAGFVRVLDGRRLAYPEYRGNGVMASLGNVSENGHVGLLFVDFFRDCVGLHVNGSASVIENGRLAELPSERRAERWMLVNVEEAYIHCAKHLPLLAKMEKKIQWGTDDVKVKGGDYFGVKDMPH